MTGGRGATPISDNEDLSTGLPSRHEATSSLLDGQRIYANKGTREPLYVVFCY